jgi:GAF domain-containing protein
MAFPDHGGKIPDHMAPSKHDVAHSPSTDKTKAYAEAREQIAAVLAGETNHVARMATVAAMLASAFDSYFWTGFYLVDPERTDELVVGPYQGTLGCLRIAFGRGVCGAAAQSGRTQIVADVHAFPGHIACDSRSNSEIVVPVWGASGELIGVLDVDSTAYDAVDAAGLEAIVATVFGALAPGPDTPAGLEISS